MIVVQRPGGGIRVCVDLSKLNKFVKRPTHPGANPKEVVSDTPLYQNVFQFLMLLKDTDKYLLQKNLISLQHSSHLERDENIFEHLWDLV